MRRNSIIIVAFAAVALIVVGALYAASNTLTSAEKTAGWKLLFDGKTLNGWKATGKAEGWTVEDGAICNTVKGGGYLYTTEQYGDFTLSLDVKYEKDSNSGVFFHWTNLNDPVQTGIEMQVLDSYGKAKADKHDFGAVYDCQEPSKNACKPAGEWNNVVLTCRKNRIFVDVNGMRVVNMNLDRWTTPHQNPDGTPNKFNIAYREMSRPGYIGLQDHGHRVWFRNIKIKTAN